MATWSLRCLTVIGKILVVNTLLVSQFVHKLLCLYSPSEEVLNKFHRIITQFIWSKKSSKIKYDKLIQNYENGGLKLVDLKIKDVS